MKVNLDISVIQGKAIEAFQETCQLAHREMIQVISDPNAFDNFPGQDIVDTGNLRASQQPPQFTSPTEAVFVNAAEYAYFVALGYTLRNGKQQPGRNWMMLALDRVDAQATFNKLLEGKL